MASKPTYPNDIVIEIILKLPVKSILRCKTLSKHYYSVIHSPYFIRRHLNLGRLNNNFYDHAIASPVQGSIILFDQTGYFKLLDLEGLPLGFKPAIFGPVNGLYCAIDPLFSFTVVLNPATKEQFISSRALPNRYYFDGNQIVTKPFHEANQLFVACGFGYDDIMDDYKVVLIYRLESDASDDYTTTVNSIVYVLNVSTGEWRNPEQSFGVIARSIKSFDGIFFRGACHWVYAFTRYSILAFDMLTESTRMIAFPNTVGDEYDWTHEFIVTFNGFLGLVFEAQRLDREERYLCFDVWVMAEYGITESWRILHRVSLKPGIMGRFLGIVMNRLYVGEYDGCLVSYDLDSKDEERYDILDGEYYNLLPYEESLVRIIKSN